MSNQRKRLNGEREDEDEEDAEGIGEWERAYVNDRSWEALQNMSLDFYGQLITVPFTMLSIAVVSACSPPLLLVLASKRGLFAISTVYIVIDFSRVHLKDLLLQHAPPPPAIANLIKMGFPQRAAEGSLAICSCHKEVKIGACWLHVPEMQSSCM